jgi:hypothetical protein
MASSQATVTTDGTEPEVELACPLCGYNLRGLTDPRCPECGFAFTWAELRDAKRDQHPWLCEHATAGRRARAFMSTWLRTCRPRRFWREVTPANPVRRRALVRYWIVAVLLMTGVIVGPLLVQGGRLAIDVRRMRANYKPVPGQPGIYYLAGTGGRLSVKYTAAQLDASLPRVWSTSFARDVADAYLRRTGGAFVAMVVVTAAWPWLTFLALMIFGESMRRAKVNKDHVLRTAVYGCDFGLLMTAVAVAMFWLWDDRAFGRPRGRQLAELGADLAMLTALVCAAATTYRLTFAYGRYLRFHLPLATVLATQVIVFLTVLAVAVYAVQAW